jgi:hypothetical protein
MPNKIDCNLQSKSGVPNGGFMHSNVVKFGVIAGGFRVVAVEKEDSFQLTLEVCSASAPIQWSLEDVSQEDIEQLKEMLIPVTRIFDKKLSEIMGHFTTSRRQ